MMEYNTKKEVREYARSVRKAISLSRRDAAHQAFIETLPSFCEYSNILSYASFGDEFDTLVLNRKLMEQGRLLLPKTEGRTIRVFKVTDIDLQLKSGFGGIMEPNPDLCEEISITDVSLVFVPALAFDHNKHRIGYGLGCYDRLLSQISPSTQCFGLGYQEQLLQFSIPTNSHDLFLSELRLF